MIVLGVDTSLRSTGYAVVSIEGTRMHAVSYGCIPNPQKLPLSQCLKNIYAKISELIEEYSPDVLSVEKVIYAKNANVMLVLGEARGAVITAAANKGIEIYEYEPRRIKMAVCGNGRAEKEQVQRMVKTLLSLDELPQNDAADAMAIAITHSHSISPLLKMNGAI
ncbi:MAG: crossover junction endodeoxyribonuclease RuvC [Kiritimatiellae bacterium]|nr:crossover junction endodeoxyribonuclease RuvC [Kiritimatiellia bacterium]